MPTKIRKYSTFR